MSYELLLGELGILRREFVPFVLGADNAVCAIEGSPTALEGACAALANLFIFVCGRACGTCVPFAVVVKPSDSVRTVPLFFAATSANNNLAPAMLAGMRLASYHLQVFDSIVGLVAIDVMNNFMRLKSATKRLLSHNLMLSSALIFAPNFRRQNYVAMTKGSAGFEAMVFCSDEISLVWELAVMPFEKAHGLSLDVASWFVIVLSDVGFLSASTVAVAVRDFLRGIIEGHHNLQLWCLIRERFQSLPGISIGVLPLHYSTSERIEPMDKREGGATNGL